MPDGNKSHDHQPADPCPDCKRMVFWCENLQDYFHMMPTATCFAHQETHQARVDRLIREAR